VLENAASPELAAEDSIGVGQLRILWAAYLVSSLGSAVSAGAIPLIAIERLHEPAGSVSVMTAFAFAGTSVIALPMGPFIERQPKQRVLRVTETLSFAALASIVAAFAIGRLSYLQLCVVLMVVTVCSILYNSALVSLLKQAIGGLLLTVVGIVSSATVDALSFAIAAILLSRRFVGEHGAIEIPTAQDGGQEKMLARVSAGLRHILTHRTPFRHESRARGRRHPARPLPAAARHRAGRHPWAAHCGQRGLGTAVPSPRRFSACSADCSCEGFRGALFEQGALGGVSG